MTSWTNSTPIRSATLSPAEPVTAQWKVSCGKAWVTSLSRVRRAPRASALWRRYELKRSASSSSTTALTVVDPTSRPSESKGSSDQNDRSVPGFTVTEPHPRPLPHPRREPVRAGRGDIRARRGSMRSGREPVPLGERTCTLRRSSRWASPRLISFAVVAFEPRRGPINRCCLSARESYPEENVPPMSLASHHPAALLLDLDGVIRHWLDEPVSRVEDEYSLPRGSIFATATGLPEYELGVLGQVSFGDWCKATADALARDHGPKENEE